MLATVLQSISSLWREDISKYVTDLRVQAGTFMFYMSELSTKSSVLDWLVLTIRKHIALGNSQGPNLSYLVSARKAISSDWLIPLCLGSAGLAGTQTSVSVTVPWQGTLVPCVRYWRDDFLSSLQAHYKWQFVLATLRSLKILKICLNILCNSVFSAEAT